MKNLTEKIYIEIIRFGSFLILLIPFLNPDIYSKTLFPYIFTKAIFFQMITGVISFFWFLLILKNKKYRPDFKNPLVISLTLFIASLFISTLFSIDPIRSFWGTQERMTGVITITHFYLWFLILISVFKKIKTWKFFIWISLFSSLLVGSSAIRQILETENIRREQIFGTLGNPIFLSVYALLNLFLALFLFFSEKNWFWKVSSLLFLIFNLIIIPLGQVRGALVSIFISSLIFLFLLIFILSQKKSKVVIIVLLSLVVLSGMFLYFERDAEWVEGSPTFLKRLLRTDLGSREIQTRIEAQRIAFQGFKEKPLTGWGWENYNIIFNKYHDPDKGFVIHSRWWDKSHNQIMDVLSTAGIIGFISYLSIFISSFYLLFKKMRKSKKREKLIAASLILFISVFIIQNFFVFDDPSSLILFYFCLALIYFFTKNEKEVPKENSKRKPFISVLALIFFTIIIYQFSFLHFKNSNLIYQAMITLRRDVRRGMILFEKAFENNSFTNSEGRYFLADFALRNRHRLEGRLKEEVYEFSIKENKKNIENHPYDSKYYLTLGRLKKEASKYNPQYLEKARSLFEESKRLSPLCEKTKQELENLDKKDY